MLPPKLYQELHVVPPLAQRSGPLQVEGAFGHSLEITCGRCGAAAMSVIPECLAEVLKIFSDSYDQLGGVAQRAPTEPREQDGGGRVERVRTRRTGPNEGSTRALLTREWLTNAYCFETAIFRRKCTVYIPVYNLH